MAGGIGPIKAEQCRRRYLGSSARQVSRGHNRYTGTNDPVGRGCDRPRSADECASTQLDRFPWRSRVNSLAFRRAPPGNARCPFLARWRVGLSPQVIEVLLDSLNAQCPRNLPETKAIEGSPPVGMSHLLPGRLIHKGIVVNSSRDERAITTALDAEIQDAVKDEYVDAVPLPFDH